MTPIQQPDEGLNAAVAAVLRAERAAQNLTVQDLAERADIPYASLRRYLGASRHIDVATLEAVADALRVGPGVLMDRALARLASEVDVYRPLEGLPRVADPHSMESAEREALEQEGQS